MVASLAASAVTMGFDLRFAHAESENAQMLDARVQFGNRDEGFTQGDPFLAVMLHLIVRRRNM
jgi:hypothetical protein